MAMRSPEPPAPPEEGKPPDGSAGSRRAYEVFSSPDGKKDQEIQQPKKKVRPLEFPEEKDMNFEVVVEDITEEELGTNCDQTHHIASTLVWIRLPDLPIELFNPRAVMRIAARAGTPVRVDRATELGARGVYARACIEVDLMKPLLSKYKVGGVEYEINYEGLDNVCFEC
ncbi:unnamed protein product, partial [Linum tenue]